jgi:hypothetical protein
VNIVGLEHVGLGEALWLGSKGGGEGERGTAGCLGRPETGVWLQHLFLIWSKSCMYLLLLLLPTTKGQEGEGLLQ